MFRSSKILAALAIAGAVTLPGHAEAQGAANPYAPAYDHEYRHGAVPTRETTARMQAWEHAHAAAFAAPTATSGKLAFGGGVHGVGVSSGKSRVFLVFYGTQWGTQTLDASGYLKFSGDAYGAAGAAQRMFKGIGTNNELWSAELTQWCDGPLVAAGATTCPASANFIPYQANGVLAGVWYDNRAAAPAAATGKQLAQEALDAAAHFGNTTAASNRYAYYVILSPHGTNPDNYKSATQGFCAWHDWQGDGYGLTSAVGDIAFSNQPYNIDAGTSCGTNFVNAGSAGMLDGYTMTLGHEWHEMMSDQFPAGGWTNHTSGSYSGQENSDECAWIAPGSAGGAANIAFSTGTFAEQASWSNDTGACAMSHPIVGGSSGGGTPAASFSYATNGLTANFIDSSTDAGGTLGSHAWAFGDGATSTATNPNHTYAAPGSYNVTETVTDSVNHSASSKTKAVTVVGVLGNGVSATGLHATTGNNVQYKLTVPAGQAKLTFGISGGTGEADLYVRKSYAPTLSTYDCRPYLTGNSETCTFNAPAAATYEVMVYARTGFTGVTLTGTYSP